MKKILKKKRILIPAILFLMTIIGMSIITFITAGTEYYIPQIKTITTSYADTALIDHSQTLKVLTLNIAHGRKDGFHQALENESTLKNNLNDIADVLKEEKADIVAFQEIDAASIWNGKYNQAKYLAKEAEYNYFILGNHVSGMGLNYGTSLISMTEMDNPLSVRFDPLPPFLTKGFVLSTINFPGHNTKVDIVSLHLTPIGSKARIKQIEKMIRILKKRTNPLIVMGDFNCTWGNKDNKTAVNHLADKMKLKAFKPEKAGLETFAEIGNKRLDWILISSELDFKNYRVIKNKLSDHSGVISEIKLLNNNNTLISSVENTNNENTIRSTFSY